jgi:hypothetical protein
MPLATREEQTGMVYVLDRYIRGRDVVQIPSTNAERPDTDLFYEEGMYNEYPERKKHYEDRRRRERMKINRVQDWAVAALDALDQGKPLPFTRRAVLEEVLTALWRAGFHGITRPEMCRLLNRDGGKVSGVMTDLHAAKIIFPLMGVRR